MHIALKTAGLMILIAYVSDNIAAFFFGAYSVFFAVLVVPVIEESARYYATGRVCWTAGPCRAALIGLFIGLGEMGTRTFEAVLFASDKLHPLLFLGVISGSIPIHIALSTAFYAIWHGRWWKMVALHALINGTGVALAVSLRGRMAPSTYIATGLAAITALCLVIGLLSLWFMRLRRLKPVEERTPNLS